MPIMDFQMGESESLDLGDAMKNGLPGDGGDGAAPNPLAPSRAGDVPAMEVEAAFEPPTATTPGTGDPGVAALSAQVQELVSERGKYGREVVGPLRAENTELREGLAELRGKFDAIQAAPVQATPVAEPTIEEVAVALYGDSVDLEDSAIIANVKAQMTAMRVTEQQVAATVAPLHEQIAKLSAQLSAGDVYAQAGIDQGTVQSVLKSNPELGDLPPEKLVSFVQRNLGKGKDGVQAPAAPSPVPSYGNPELVVDGGPGVFGNPADTPSPEQNLENFKAIRKSGYGVNKSSVADAQKAALLGMIQNGSVFR